MGGCQLEVKKRKEKRREARDGGTELDVGWDLENKKRKAQDAAAADGVEKNGVASLKKKKKKKKRREGGEEIAEGAVDGALPEAKSEEEEGIETEKLKSEKFGKGRKAGGEDDDSAVQKAAAIQSAVVGSDRLAVIVDGNGTDDPKFEPLTSFDVPGVPENVLACCKQFDKPSPIQAYSWPFLLAGRDMIGIARTGSGKTLGFGIPLLVHVLKKKPVKSSQPSPLALVLAPTRELTQQIAEVLEEAGSSCGVKTACVYGGTPKGPQKVALKAGATIIVATPGRLQDLLEEQVCSLDLVTYVVLDEADRMLDLGFEPAVRAIINLTAKNRQTLMFSATWPVTVDKLGKEFMRDSNRVVKVTVGSEDLTANHDVTQIVEVIGDLERIRRLESLLQKYHKSRKNRVLVFVLYKKEAVRIESVLRQRGWEVAAVHGDKGQADRTRAVQAFRDGKCPLLVATDVAARGLDIPDVEYVINYSFPLTVEDYVHRIGRTGRAGKKGLAHTFFTQADKARAGELVNVLRESGQNVPEDLLKFGTHVKKKESAVYGAHFKEIGASAKQSTKITFDASDED